MLLNVIHVDIPTKYLITVCDFKALKECVNWSRFCLIITMYLVIYLISIKDQWSPWGGGVRSNLGEITWFYRKKEGRIGRRQHNERVTTENRLPMRDDHNKVNEPWLGGGGDLAKFDHDPTTHFPFLLPPPPPSFPHIMTGLIPERTQP